MRWKTIRAIFSNAYIGLVRAGESGNALNDVLTRLADYLDSNERLNEQVKSALVYPIMLDGHGLDLDRRVAGPGRAAIHAACSKAPAPSFRH